MSLEKHFPILETALQLEPEELAIPLLKCLIQEEESRGVGQLNLHNFVGTEAVDRYAGVKVDEVVKAITEAWIWLERERLYRELGKELALDDLVFANVEGKPLDPGVLTHNFARIAKRTGLENVRFHDLRHTFASLMLLRGAKPKVISEALGHSSVAFTMDVYSHIIEGMQSDAMAPLDKILPAGKNGMSQRINANLTPNSPKVGAIS